MELNLKDKHVLITGGSKGIGYACAAAFLAEGARVSLVSRSREHLEAGMLPGFIQVLAQIPKTASEKPQDRFLMEAFEREPQSVHRRMVRV